VAILGIQRPGSSHISTHHRVTHQIPDQSDNSEDDDDDNDDDDDDDDVDVQAATLEGFVYFCLTHNHHLLTFCTKGLQYCENFAVQYLSFSFCKSSSSSSLVLML
jgi:hypothetical protein